MIYLSCVLIAVSSIGKNWILMVFLLLCPIYGSFYYKSKISFETSKLFVKMVLVVTRNDIYLLFLKFLGVGVQTAFLAAWCYTLESVIIRHKSSEINSVQLAFIFLYLVRDNTK